MKNNYEGWQSIHNGIAIQLPISYDDDGNLLCQLPGEVLKIQPYSDDSQAQKQDLLSQLNSRGYEIRGCFNCRFFKFAPDQGVPPWLGYCLFGKLGKEFKFFEDTTTIFNSCENYSFGDEQSKEAVLQEWVKARPTPPIPPPRKK